MSDRRTLVLEQEELTELYNYVEMLQDLATCFRRILNGERIKEMLAEKDKVLQYNEDADKMLMDENSESSFEQSNSNRSTREANERKRIARQMEKQ